MSLAGALGTLTTSVAVAREFARPGTRDLAVDWVQAHVPAGEDVLTADRAIGLDRERFRVFQTRGVPSQDSLLARTVDAVIISKERLPVLLPGQRATLSSAPHGQAIGPSLAVYLVPPTLHALPVPLEPAMLSSSTGESELPNAVDGRLDTYWRGAREGEAPTWVEITLGRAVRAGRIDLLLGQRPGRAGRRFLMDTSEDGVTWLPVDTAEYSELSPGGDEAAGPPSQVLVFTPLITRHLRIVAQAAPGHRWGFAEIRMYELRGG